MWPAASHLCFIFASSQPITVSMASHRRCSRVCVAPLSERSSALKAAAARCGQNLSPISTLLSSLLSCTGTHSTGTSKWQLSICPFFTSICKRAEQRAGGCSFVSSSCVSMVNLGVFPNVQSQLRSSISISPTPGNMDSLVGSMTVNAECRPNSETRQK